MNASHDVSAFQSRFLLGTKSVAWLVAVELIVLALVGWFGFARSGQLGLLAAVLACAICLVPAIAGLYAVAFTAGSMVAIAGVFGSMGVRMAVAVFVVIFMPQATKPLAEVGFLGMVLINYFVVLAVETVLAVLMIQAHEPTPVGP